MEKDIQKIEQFLKDALSKHTPPLQNRVNSDTNFEMAGTKPAMQGKKKVDGYYFASVMPKPKDIRLYFFPIYTHPDQFELSPELDKCLKGKSCFHIKKLSPEMQKEIEELIERGVKVYEKEGLI